MAWINIKDKLPPEGITVLIYFKHEGLEYTVCGSRYEELGIEGHCMHLDREEYQDKITHWMSMPTTPKKTE